MHLSTSTLLNEFVFSIMIGIKMLISSSFTKS